MTAGEAYSLVRRRRDERNAALHPSFCLQHAQADTQSRASSNYTAHRFNRPTRKAVGGQPHSDAIHQVREMNAILETPSAGNLVVMLTEVRVLSYLANHSQLTAKVHKPLSIYGPTSVYSSGDDGTLKAEDSLRADETVPRAAVKLEGCNEEDVINTSASTSSEESRLRASLHRVQPGTIGHVRCVQQLFDLYEARGRSTEAKYAAAIGSVVRRVQHQAALGQTSGSVKVFHGIKEEPLESAVVAPTVDAGTVMKGDGGHVSSALRPFLAAPTPLTHPGTPHTTTSGRGLLHLSEAEVMQLVVGQPRTSLEVHRLLDNLELKCGGREELVDLFVDGITEVFGGSSAKDEGSAAS